MKKADDIAELYGDGIMKKRWLLWLFDFWVKTEFIWLRLGVPGVLLEHGYYKFGFLERLGNCLTSGENVNLPHFSLVLKRCR